MDNKFIFKEVTQTLLKPHIFWDPMPQQEPSYWLMKSEPDAYSINTEKSGVTLWDRLEIIKLEISWKRWIKVIDFFLSRVQTPGIVGLMEVIDLNVVDPTQFDKDSKYFNQKSKPEKRDGIV